MGTNDRDYWREKYNETTNYTEKSNFRVGLSDPTHWREDELQTPSFNRGKGSTNAKPSKFWSWHNRLLLCALLVAALLKIYQHFQQQPQQLYRLPTTYQQSLPAPAEPRPSLEQLALEQQRLEAEQRKAAAAAEFTQREHERERREAAKAAAWANYFQPSAFCKVNATVECANAYIRAKNKFNAEWSD